MSEVKQIGNWGRWGADDERGALNLLSPEVILQAMQLVRKGKVYSLSLPIQQRGVPSVAVRVPPLHLMSLDAGDYAVGTKPFGCAQVADDYVMMGCHAGTHTDALAHVWSEDKLYNGHSSTNVRSAGARRCGVEKMKWLVGRGVLLDIAGYKGVEQLPASYLITAEDLEGCARRQEVEVRAGDSLLIRTGWLKMFEKDHHAFEHHEPGIGMAAGRWIAVRDIVAVAADNLGVEVAPAEDAAEYIPVHVELMRNYGIYLMELFQLDELARDRVYEFLLMVAPLQIRGGVGSPVNPLAIC